MDELCKRLILFIFGCIGIRCLFVIIAKNSTKKNLKYLGYLALIPVIGFIYSSYSKKEIGFFKGKVWWANLRLVHACLYLFFAINAINGNENAWIYLLIDVLIGTIGFIVHHYKNGDFIYCVNTIYNK
jgi:hypothetical protein